MASMQHADLTGRILECAFKVQNKIGAGFFEKVYENALLIEFERAGLAAENQVPLKVYYDGYVVGNYVADIIVEGKVLLEIKGTQENPPIYFAQVLNYLKATGLPVGLLLNFGEPKLFYRRFEPRFPPRPQGNEPQE